MKSEMLMQKNIVPLINKTFIKQLLCLSNYYIYFYKELGVDYVR